MEGGAPGAPPDVDRGHPRTPRREDRGLVARAATHLEDPHPGLHQVAHRFELDRADRPLLGGEVDRRPHRQASDHAWNVSTAHSG